MGGMKMFVIGDHGLSYKCVTKIQHQIKEKILIPIKGEIKIGENTLIALKTIKIKPSP